MKTESFLESNFVFFSNIFQGLQATTYHFRVNQVYTDASDFVGTGERLDKKSSQKQTFLFIKNKDNMHNII